MTQVILIDGRCHECGEQVYAALVVADENSQMVGDVLKQWAEWLCLDCFDGLFMMGTLEPTNAEASQAKTAK